jgi:hypothetical protein
MSATPSALARPAIRAPFFNRRMLRAARLFRSQVGYGLYTARRPMELPQP